MGGFRRICALNKLSLLLFYGCGAELNGWMHVGAKWETTIMFLILFLYVALFGFALHLLVLSPPPFIHFFVLAFLFCFVLFCGNFVSIQFILFIHFFYSYIFSNQLDLGLFLCYLI
jgi:hypothetical protein